MNSAYARSIELLGTFFIGITIACGAMLEADQALPLVKNLYLLANSLLYVGVILNPRRGGISFMVSFFFLFFVAVPAFVQSTTGSFPFMSSYSAPQIVQGYFLMSIAQFCLCLGIFVADSKTESRTEQGEPMRPEFWIRATALLLVMSVAVVAFVGPGNLLLTRTERGDATGELGARASAIFVGRSLSLMAAVLCIYLLVKYPPIRRRSSFHLLSILVFPTFLLLNYPPGLARFQMFGSALALLAVSVSLFAARAKLLAGVVAPVFLFLFFPAIKSLGRGEDIDFAGAVQRDVYAYLQRVDFDGFKQTIDTWIYVQSGGEHRHGENFLGVFLFWVPRGVWDAKPLDSGLLVSSSLGYPYNNVSSPLPAEAYVSFGLIGVVALMAIAGYSIARVESKARLSQTSQGLRQEVLLYALAVGFAVIILRGALNGVAPIFGTGFLAYAVLAKFHNAKAVTRTRESLLT